MGTMILAEGESASTLLSTLSSNMGTITSAVSSLCGTIVSSELLSLSLNFFFVGGVIGLIGRALRRK